MNDDGILRALALLCDTAQRWKLDAEVYRWAIQYGTVDKMLEAFPSTRFMDMRELAVEVARAPDEVLWMRGEPPDADDCAAAFAAALLSLHIPCALVAEDHGMGFTHVTVEVAGKRYDPTYGHGPGEGAVPVRTLRMECKG